ncbi:ABC transporter substrate-binding protein (plasmid) [Qingshengfaniella alkalisoli]|uniref:ABC transporter substrate-binding protein n=2 Tax=Qingshengfaniella alkalisoli TaxID=2599296 RepID=A0A5B8IZ77_9RHOB|nr:ABC transporter substrate-binding protein [Qingshengfaniella alkalisoli]QDY71004.1 ABC transporter substrate-binding protein [Qingshengfaniella alkalisoli]
MGATMLTSPVFAEGVIDVAIIGEPPTLDPMMSTADVVSIVTQHFFETLYTFDENWAVVPLLAQDMPEISEDGLTYRIPLREGITFHDGSTMDSADVVASLQRWLKVSTRGKGVAEQVAGIETDGANTVVITLTESYSPLLSLLAFSNAAAMIVPEEVLGEELSAIVGTGPYKLEEHLPDQYIQVTRFDDYVSREEPSSGGSGKREQILDEIRFVPVPDAATRVEGVLSGQFQFADGLPTEAYDRIESTDGVEPMLLAPFGWPIFAFNLKEGLMADQNVRSAVQAALAPEDMLYAAFGDEKFFVTDAALFPESFQWHNEEGAELYNQADAAKSQELLSKAGYDGSPLRILTSHQYEFHYKMAEVAKVYLEAGGFTVELDVVDWATLTQQRDNPAAWDIYITHSPFLPEPALTSMYSPTSRLGWANEEKDAVLKEFTSETDPEKRLELFAELQKLVYEQAPFYKVGGFNTLLAKSTALDGVTETPWPYFWNASLSE